MNPDSTRVLQTLLRDRRVAALGTLQDGEPSVSMVPFAVSDDARRLIIHVSGLASHTRNLQVSDAVSLMIMDREDPVQMAQALARVTVQGSARVLDRGDGGYSSARQAYLERFPDAADLFEFPDFRLVAIDAREARLVAGFGRAHTLYPEDLTRLAGRSAERSG